MLLYQSTFPAKDKKFVFKTLFANTERDGDILLGKIKNSKSPLWGLDIETGKTYLDLKKSGLDPRLSFIRLLQLFDGHSNAYVFDLNVCSLDKIMAVIKDFKFVAHSAIFELMHLTHAGYPELNIGCSMLLSQLVSGAEFSPCEPEEDIDEDDDTQNGLWQYRFRSHSLDSVVQREFGVKVDKTAQTSDWNGPLTKDQINYAALDAVLTYHVAKKIFVRLKEYKMTKPYKLLKQTQYVLVDMQLHGLPVDWEYHQKLMQEWKVSEEIALKQCLPYFYGINMRSSKQMGNWLGFKYPELVDTWPRTSKGALAFGKNVLAAYKHLPAITMLLEYKRWSKLIDTYGDSLVAEKHPVTNRLHSSYTLGETMTGRMSSRSPNAQNYPRKRWFRDIFCAPEDEVLVVSDFSQIELRLQAELSGDPVMLENYRTGGDIYCRMASEIFGVEVKEVPKDHVGYNLYLERRFVGKTVMLALGYGMGPKKLGLYALNAGIDKPQEYWHKAWSAYHKLFAGYSRWCDKIRNRVTSLGYANTLLGKRRKLLEEELFTRGPNTVIQGTACELMMRALCICRERIKGLGVIVATVHDEILILCKKLDAPSVSVLLSGSMNDAMLEMFPNTVCSHVADAAFARRWGEAKSEL